MNHAPTALLTALAILTMVGCACDRTASRSATPPPKTTTEEAPVTPPMQPTAQTEMTPGAALTPSDALLAWLESNATRGDGHALMRLPVVVRFRPDKLGAAGAHIGTTPGDAPAGAVELELSDTALSVGLWDRIRQSCDLDQGACVLWLEGYWRELLPMPGLPGLPGLDDGPKSHPFDVRDVAGPVDPATTSVLIAK